LKINIEQFWYSKNILAIFLLPLSWLFRLASYLRRTYYKYITANSSSARARVIIVGNISVGGAGKTPFVAYLAKQCSDKNIGVAIVSRGYGRENENTLVEVHNDSDVTMVGDEALMLKQQCSCPVVVAADRNEAVRYLNEKYDLDLVISDDGLQHYKLHRDYEIIIVDGEREFGNGWCLPAGPLREPVSRLETVDIVISNGENNHYELIYNTHYNEVVSLTDELERLSLGAFAGLKVHAVAGIGYPKRFFNLLEKQGLEVNPHCFRDHHAFRPLDLDFGDDLPVIMTEKDAVKCVKFKNASHWFLPVNAKLEAGFIDALVKKLASHKV